ncbi:MAG: hypothetical protein C3F12_00160 [Candidatus Methylomirabilota bacterium]|nr:hypothetical protein [Candidatus Methylomirabilis sp.]NJD68498.1 hypothetical protein [candidate division NC10 bacterium]PWB48949.1 MAG: hypothetical protein C3F12_00160 [candidate division NC10 bacterium]
MLKNVKMLMGLVAAAGAVLVGSPAYAEATWTVDVAGLTTDVTTIGLALLGVAVIIYGFRVVRRMVGH